MSFDFLAPHYRWMEFVLAGKKLQRCRTTWLDQISLASNILLLGEGNGRFLPACCRRFPNALITCVDGSAGMLAQAERRLAEAGIEPSRVKFLHADILEWLPVNGRHDLIVTNFFLDCFRPEQVARIVEKIGVVAAPDVSWLLADFQVAESGIERWRSQAILATMYAFFRVMTRLPARRLTAPDPFLAAAGFKLRRRAQSEWGLLRSDWWQRTG